MYEKINLGFKGKEDCLYIKDNKVYAYCSRTKWRIVCEDYLAHKYEIDNEQIGFKIIHL